MFRGILTLAQLGWLIWFGLVIWAPPFEGWLQQSFHGWATASLAAAGGISGAFSVIVGRRLKDHRDHSQGVRVASVLEP